MIFRLVQYQFSFRAVESIFFPPGKAGNVWRGALGPILPPGPVSYKRGGGGPSGFADPPRPWLIRAADCDGKRFEAGERFGLDVHVFDSRVDWLRILTEALGALGGNGIGPRRGRLEVAEETRSTEIRLDLGAGEDASACSIRFRTPTELKGNPRPGEMPFDALFARARDRIGLLSRLYGEGSLEVDFRGQLERAARVRTARRELRYEDIRRRSSRTGAEHGIGGVTGWADYEGELGEFLPYLRAARWTGVGRHTAWGNGAIEVASR